jgi:hypothetical protein
MFAQGFLDFGLTEGVLFIVRIIATVGGAVAGWFVCDPLTRLLYRASFRGATPGAILFSAKTTGAVTASLLIWFFMPLGGGGGGLGWGPGLGGGPGKGAGPGGDKVAANGKDKPGKDAKDNKDTTLKSIPQREPVEIEILGGPRFKEDGVERYYLLRLKSPEPPRSLAELEEYFKENHAKLLITIVHTDDTAVLNTDEGPTRKLRKLANKYEIPTQGPKEEP